MSTKFFTNEEENTLLNKISGVFKYKNIHFFDALIGFFRASGYFRIREFIESAEEIRILAGINVDYLIYQSHKQGLLFDGDTAKAQERFLRDLKQNIQEAEYDKKVEDGIFQLIQDIASSKVKIRIHPRRNIHAKLYIFREEEKHPHGYGSVITGSSNLTEAGLIKNFEFNVELRDNSDIDFATKTFEKLWLESIPVDIDSVEKLQKETYLNNEFSPYEVYLKFLIEYFGESVEFDPNSVSDLPKGFKRLSYQIDAVNDGFAKMMKHNGFFLADVVGLGKTIVSILIARKYFYQNGFPSYRSRTLIVTPPALEEHWSDTVRKFNLDNVRIITNGSLHKIKDAEIYDLVIVDEAHKFRSDTAEMYNALQKICKTSSRRFLADGSNVKKKVVLVSATPLNNEPGDIANQIYLFQDSKNSTLEISNLQSFFSKHIEAYKKLKKEKDISKVQVGVKQIYADIRTKVIEALIVRRTRTDLLAHKLYSEDLKKQGVKFPEVKQPKKILYQLEPWLEALYDKTIFTLSHPKDGLTYNRYRAIGFLTESKKSRYKSADLISIQLATIMKTLLVKRIDSSFHAFKQSLNRFLDGTRAMVTMFENGQIFIAPNLPVTEMINDGREEELANLILQNTDENSNMDICIPEDFHEDFLPGLQKDLKLLTELSNEWSKVNEDPKLEMFVKYLQEVLLSKSINPQCKLVVFSESKETTAYLEENLLKRCSEKIISIDSQSRKNKMSIVKKNFDANLPRKEQANDFNIILTTEVLAEGVNLHRANVIVNYDTPWNSTRLMQRIGRVNRIGSTADEIHVYNFYPTTKVNNDIELEKKAIMKLQSFHAALGEDSQIYSPAEETESFGLFDKTIEEEQDEKLAYLMFLRDIKEKKPNFFKRLKNMPLRSRVGRIKKDLANSSICYIKNDKRDAFISVSANEAIEELTFLETAKIFEADPTEKAVPLHLEHHKQVNSALSLFSELVEQEKARDKKIDTRQGPNEKKAARYLDALLNMRLANDDETKLIEKAKEALRKGKFQNLQREINKLQNSVKKNPMKPAVILKNIIGILNKYPLIIEENRQNAVDDNLDRISLKPEIIISESFCKQ